MQIGSMNQQLKSVIHCIFSIAAVVMPLAMLFMAIAVFIVTAHSYDMEYWVFSVIVALVVLLLALITYHDLKKWKKLEQQIKQYRKG